MGRPCSIFGDMFQISVITMLMGALELDERKLLAAFAAAMVFVITFALVVLQINHNRGLALASAGAFLFATGLALISLRRFSRKIEGLDGYAWKFDEVRKKLLDGVPTDERGPASMKVRQLVAQDSADVLANLERAQELLHDFVRDVLDRATELDVREKGKKGGGESSDSSEHCVIRYSTKGRERALEKARWDYNGNGARVCDLLRGCIITPSNSMAEVRVVCGYVQELEQKGVIKNRSLPATRTATSMCRMKGISRRSKWSRTTLISSSSSRRRCTTWRAQSALLGRCSRRMPWSTAARRQASRTLATAPCSTCQRALFSSGCVGAPSFWPRSTACRMCGAWWRGGYSCLNRRLRSSVWRRPPLR